MAPVRRCSTLVRSSAVAIAAGLLSAIATAAGAPAPLAAQTTATSIAAVDPPGFTLQPGDVVRMRIWREEDLSGDFGVDEGGRVVLPKIGPVTVVGLSADSIDRMLVNTYAEYLRNPAIEVTLLRRINIMGAVQKPGVYPVDLTMTVADALALAGGASPNGKIDEAVLVRDGERLAFDLTKSTRIAETPLQSGDQLFVPERGWLSRNGWVVGAALTATTSVLIALMR